jgi:hypothetical protein
MFSLVKSPINHKPIAASFRMLRARVLPAIRLLAILACLSLLSGITACRNDDDSESLKEPTSPSAEFIEPAATLAANLETLETPTSSPSPTVLSPPTPPATRVTELEPTETPQLPSNDLSIKTNDISIYPKGSIYEGDLISVRIDPRIPARIAPNDIDVRVYIDGVQVVSNNVNWRSLDGTPFGLFQWVWDSDSRPGRHSVIVFLDPEDAIISGDESPANNVASTTMVVKSSENLPEAVANAQWSTEETDCCRVHVVTGTEANRDLADLLGQVEESFLKASIKLGEQITGKYDVYLVDRVFGQGGYAQNSMVVSYLDRDYIGGGLDELLVHEAVHLLDRRIASNPITFLSEGLAVWIAGGHYQQQNLEKRAAALLDTGNYRPLDQVIDDFFGIQHEIGYLQGAGFIDYLVANYGWDRVKTFYGETSARDGDTLSEAVDVNLRRVFGSSLEQIESDWITHLSSVPRNRIEEEDLLTTLRYYNLIRRYQSIFDPMAYYMTTWLPDPEIAERLGATADLSRQPGSAVNIALETMLVSASSTYLEGDYVRANALLDSVERVLDNNGAFLDPLALSYLDIVLTAGDLGYEAQHIDLIGNQAIVLGSHPDKDALVQIDLALEEGRSWSLAR